MSGVVRLTLPAAILSLAACSPMPPTVKAAPEQSASVRPVQTEPAALPLPEVKLSDDLMYDLLLGELAGQRGQLALAAEHYLNAARVSGDPRVAKRAAHIAIFHRDYDRALEAARLWVSAAPEDLEGRQSLATLLLRTGDVDAAVEQLETVLARAGDAQGLLVAASLLGQQDDREMALEAMRRLVAPRENDPHALYAYAQLAHTLGEYGAAAESLREVVARNPEDRRALLLMASVQQRLGEGEAALESLRRAVAAAPQDADLRLAYARSLVGERKLKEARQQFEAVAGMQPDNADVLYALGLLAMEADDFDAAERSFRRLLELGERVDEATYALGQVAELQKDYDTAIEWYEKVAGENQISARMRAAGIISRERSVEEALAYLDALALPAQDAIQIVLAKAELLRTAERFQDALDVYSAGLEAFPDSTELLYGRAMAAERLGRIDQLETDLRAVIAADPENVQALNALGYTLADRTERYDEALGLIEQALALEPSDPAILDSMGWVLYKLGRTEEALDYLRRALAVQEDGEIAAHLGEVLWVTGARTEAMEVWQRASEYAADNAVLKRTRERFAP